MKHTVTELNDPNEPIMFSNSILSNICFDTFFGELETKLYAFTDSNTQYEILHSAQIAESNCTLVYSSSTNFYIELTDPNLWTLYFDGSRNNVGVDASYLLIDLHGNRQC